jgi:transmembrane sensor
MNTQIYEEASEWIVRNREADLGPAEKKRFDTWLRQSPQHVRAYLEMSAIWEDVPALEPRSNPDASELIARARAEDNVVALGHERGAVADSSAAVGGSRRLVSSRRAGVSWKRGYALAASILVALVVGLWAHSLRDTYSTDVGEQRSIVLSDGSTIELNSRSRVRVRFSAAQRDVDLLEGQALFRVAKNPDRPFLVHSDTTRVRAVGTQFDVYRKSGGSIVTVIEGRVAVLAGVSRPAQPQPAAGRSAASLQDDVSAIPQGASATGSGTTGSEVDSNAATGAPRTARMQAGAGEVLVTAGEQLTVVPARPLFPVATDVRVATAWRQRSLVFNASPLTEVAEEFNRYNTRQLIIENPELRNFHVSGVFSSVDPALLLRFLRSQSELVVEETDTEIRIDKK